MSQKLQSELASTLSNKNNLLLIAANLVMTGLLFTLATSHSQLQLSQKPQVLAAQISPTPFVSQAQLRVVETSPTHATTQTPTPTHTPSPTDTPQPTRTPTIPSSDITPTPQSASTQAPSGISEQILDALNAYRQKKGVTSLSWDNTLGNYAQSRADTYVSLGGLDNHAGFQSVLNNDGFAKLGFNALGENASWGDFHDAIYLIETMYAGDAPHDQNQLNSQWTHVGIGVNGVATDLVFGGNKR